MSLDLKQNYSKYIDAIKLTEEFNKEFKFKSLGIAEEALKILGFQNVSNLVIEKMYFSTGGDKKLRIDISFLLNNAFKHCVSVPINFMWEDWKTLSKKEIRNALYFFDLYP